MGVALLGSSREAGSARTRWGTKSPKPPFPFSSSDKEFSKKNGALDFAKNESKWGSGGRSPLAWSLYTSRRSSSPRCEHSVASGGRTRITQRWAVLERPLQGRRPATGGYRRVNLDNSQPGMAESRANPKGCAQDARNNPGQAGIERRTKAQPHSPELGARDGGESCKPGGLRAGCAQQLHGHTPSDVEAAEGIARGIGPSGAEHSPAQGATLGNRRPPARSHKRTNSSPGDEVPRRTEAILDECFRSILRRRRRVLRMHASTP